MPMKFTHQTTMCELFSEIAQLELTASNDSTIETQKEKKSVFAYFFSLKKGDFFAGM